MNPLPVQGTTLCAHPAEAVARFLHEGCADTRMVLRLEQPDDRKALRDDLLGASPKLRDPQGLDYNLHRVPKQLALSGSLPGSEWDCPLVEALMKEGAPVLFLPHTTTAPLQIPYSPDLHLACMQVAGSGWLRQVICPDKLVSAVPLSEFIEWLHRRPEFPVEGCLSSLSLGQKCWQADPLPGPPLKKRRVRKPKEAVKAAAEEHKVAEATPEAA